MLLPWPGSPMYMTLMSPLLTLVEVLYALPPTKDNNIPAFINSWPYMDGQNEFTKYLLNFNFHHFK